MTWLATDFRHERKWKMAQVRIHFIIVMIRWTGLAPWEFEYPLQGSLTSTFLKHGDYLLEEMTWLAAGIPRS